MHAIAQEISAAPSLITTFREELRRRFATKLGWALRELRKLGRRPDGSTEDGSFAALRAGPWQVFSAIAAHWGTHARGHEAWPSQESIALYWGVDERTVRAWLGPLLQGGFLVSRRERWRDAKEHLIYAPGPATLAGLEAWIERYPRGDEAPMVPPQARAKHLRPVPNEGALFSGSEDPPFSGSTIRGTPET